MISTPKSTARDVKIAAVMTAGRSENTWARNVIESAVKTLGIPLAVSQGVYYGQCMQKMLEGLCKTDCDYVVTIDGDSIFKAEQLKRLIDLIVQEEQIDALCGLQLRRGRADILGASAARQVKWNGYPVKLTSAHFGLTVIDIAKLRTVPKPWFFSQPNEQGEWEEGKIDCDMWFWLQWGKAGHSVYTDPGCRLGHLEEMVSTFDDNMHPVHLYPADYCCLSGGPK